METILKYRRRSIGEIILLVAIIFIFIFSCDKYVYLNLYTHDNRFVQRLHANKPILQYEDEKIEIIAYAIRGTGWSKKDKSGRMVGVHLDLLSNSNFKFEALKSFIVDNNNAKLFPHAHSIFNSDNFYKSDKEHSIAIVFRSDTDIQSKSVLHLPAITYINEGDTLELPEIILE